MPITFLLGAFNWFRSTWIGKAIAIAVGVLLAVLFIFQRGKAAERQQQHVRDLELSEDIRERDDVRKKEAIRDADALSHDELVERLRSKGRLRN